MLGELKPKGPKFKIEIWSRSYGGRRCGFNTKHQSTKEPHQSNTEGRVVGPCWEKLKPKGPKAPKHQSTKAPQEPFSMVLGRIGPSGVRPPKRIAHVNSIFETTVENS